MFSFVIRNAEVIKQMKLSGSDDMKQWFVVKEWESCGPFRNNKNDSIISLYPIPVSDYEYFKIEIDDKHSDPVNIIKIGYYEDATNYGGLTEIKSTLQITDSSLKKTTWAHIIFNENVSVNVVEFKINKPEYYHRTVNVYGAIDDTSKRKRIFTESITLNSKFNNSFDINTVKIKELWFEILNEDNPGLDIAAIKVFQINHYFIARLEKDKHYKLVFGDAGLNAPKYDLKYFQSTIPDDLKVIIPDSVIRSVKPESIVNSSKSIFKDNRFIWAAIIIVALLLGFVTYRMIKDMK
jgi:hypothetical protein